MALKQLRRLIRLTKTAQTQSISIQRKILLSWSFMILTFFAAVLLVLSLSGVFSTARQNLGYALTTQQANSADEINGQINILTAQGVALSQQTTDILEGILYTEHVSAMNDSPELLMAFQRELTDHLKTVLQSGPCNGAYAIIDATINSGVDQADSSRTGVYLRFMNLSSESAINQDVTFYRGIAEVARENRLELHNRWNLEFNLEHVPGYGEQIGKPVEDLASRCYWSGRVNLPDTWENVYQLMVPIRGSDGSVQGICGVELSDLYFRLLYPAKDSEFGNMVTILAPIKDGVVDLKSGINGCLDGTNLDNSETLSVKDGRFFNTYTGPSGTYLGLHTPADMKVLGHEEMYILTLIPEEGLLAAETGSRLIWTGCSLLVLLAMLLISSLVMKRFIQPISDSLSALVTEDPQNYSRSGIIEIDEIAQFLQKKAQVQESMELPPNIEELFHEFSQRVATLTPTERTILQYYIDGLSLEEVATKAYISINTAKKHNTNLNRKLGVKSREELLLYIDLFRRGNRLGEIAYLS